MQSGSGSRSSAPGKSPSPSTVSPSSSSEQQQQQQQFGFRQSSQHHQFKSPEGEKGFPPYRSGGVHGAMAGNSLPPSSSALPKKSNDLPPQHGGSQIYSQNQNEGQASYQNPSQNAQNPVHQAYLMYALQAAQQKSLGNNQAQQQGKMPMFGTPGREQDIRAGNMKMQELMSHANHQVPGHPPRKPSEPSFQASKQAGQLGPDQRSDIRLPQTGGGQLSRQAPQSQGTLPNVPNNQLAMAQLQAMHAWALENGIDMSLPANASLVAQLLPAWQSRTSEVQRSEETMTAKQPSPSQQVGCGNSVRGNSSINLPGHGGFLKNQQDIISGSASTPGVNYPPQPDNIQIQQQFNAKSNIENQNDRIDRNSTYVGNSASNMNVVQHSSSTPSSIEQSAPKNQFAGPEKHRVQNLRESHQLDCSAAQPGPSSSNDATNSQSTVKSESVSSLKQQVGFTKQQLHVLKAQILAFRRLRIIVQSGQGAMPEEILRAIVPPPLDFQSQHLPLASGVVRHDKNMGGHVNENVGHPESLHNAPQVDQGQYPPKEEVPTSKEMISKVGPSSGMASMTADDARPSGRLENSNSANSEVEPDRGIHHNSNKCDADTTKGGAYPPQGLTDGAQAKKPPQTGSAPSKDAGSTRKYHGPIFDFPFFMRKPDSFGSMTSANHNNLVLAYDVNDLLSDEGAEVLIKKREENLQKIGGLLSMNIERKRIRPDLVLRLQIEERKLRLLDRQARLRDELDHQQQEIMAMPDRPYRKFVKQCERQRAELLRQIQLSQKAAREKQLKAIFQWRKKLLEAHWAIRDARTTRNRGIAKYHERMLREFSKRKDDDRNKRMEALKNNDVDRYREMLLEQQTNISGDAAQRYSVLSSFLTQTEEYLHKLGGKITATKNQQEVEDAARIAAAAARAQGLSEEEVKAAAACAGEEVMIRNRFSEMNAPKDNSSVNKYYNLAHAVNERVFQQPSMLRAGTLRDYQLVGLQWMLSLYNNKLNGILADEMGLGKTVQVMALIAYLMEFKGNYGPHLIIVPNAVLVNWKSELYNWLPSVSCLFYVGGKDQRAKLFSQEVCAMKFNVLVTTYEFVMYDRSKLSKVDWKYIIIDEAQRMKDRESVLARDLDRYRCQRRLLLTGTPLQNDLKELWSLLNLLLPEVFDNRKAFSDWFSKPFQKDVPSHSQEEDDWLETEKKVIIIHRLHQILEPFMLRRRVEDVEGSLPRKVSIVLRCRMSAMQGAIYDWIKATGTIRVDPEDELRKAQKNPSYQTKMYKNLNNKCMELRKACNHPLLNYPFYNDYSKGFVVRSCGKLWMLDRILIKLQKTGHRVLLFSTMTKLLDILEEYLQWRRLSYRRIDGSTSLEDRESAIVDFNSPDYDCFIFLLSIRAAGRGLNLQTADTVVIYDPDPNPQNEEQAVARAHRIGQQREVKVIYLEAVVDKMSSYEKEDELRNGGTIDSDDELAGKDRYIGSIESLIRNNIQQYKIDMADEVINAGRFDQRTTHEERRMTLETLLHDDERYQETVHDVPSLQEVNRMIARSEEEIELFDQMDEEFDWTGEMMKYHQVPKWLRAGSGEINALVASLSKKPSRNILSGNKDLEPRDTSSGLLLDKAERRRGRPRAAADKRYSVYAELDDEESDASSEDIVASSSHEEEEEIGEDGDDEANTVAAMPPSGKDQTEEALIGDVDTSEFYQGINGTRYNPFLEETNSGSSGSIRLQGIVTPSGSQKFGSLSALDAKPEGISNRLPEDLEEGEIALSSDSHMDLQQSQNSIPDHDEGEYEHILQPKLKRKRSIRVRPRFNAENLEQACKNDRIMPQQGYQLPLLDPDSDRGEELNRPSSERQEMAGGSTKIKKQSGGSLSSKSMSSSGHSNVGTKMPDAIQRKCKGVISKLQRKVENGGRQIVPIISGFWKSSKSTSKNILDPRGIIQRVDNFKYNGVSDFVTDVQFMLKNLVQYFGCSYEVNSEAKKIHDLFLDIISIVFPNTDFHSERHTIIFSASGVSVPGQSPKPANTSQNKRHKLTNDAEAEPGSKRTTYRGPVSADEDARLSAQGYKSQKDNRSSGGSTPACSPPFPAHPGDLVICKGKRKDRDKSSLTPRVGPASPSTPGSRGLASPSSFGRAGSDSPVKLGRSHPASSGNTAKSARSPFQKDQHQSQQAKQPVGWTRQQPHVNSVGGVSSVIEEVQWAKPVKKMRTDKRRPSHL